MTRIPSVLEFRGETVESRHPFTAAWCHVGGEVELWGDDWTTTWRSAAKPFQLAVSVEAIGEQFEARELAIGAASHSGEPQHLSVVDGLLSRFHLSVEHLQCGTHPPIHQPSGFAVMASGGSFDHRHNNCSGKHSFMAAAAHKRGWPVDYRAADHPYQKRLMDKVTAWAGAAPSTSIDGCGVPTFCLPISAMARAWASLAEAMSANPQSVLGQIGWAMRQHPELTSGTNRFDAHLAGCARAPLAGKIGARGVFCVALPSLSAGLAVKMHSGSMEALAAAVPAALERWAPGAIEPPAAWPPLQVRNVIGDVVGHWVLA